MKKLLKSEIYSVISTLYTVYKKVKYFGSNQKKQKKRNVRLWDPPTGGQ